VRLISKSMLLEMVPYTVQHIYRLEKAGKFPKRVRIGANRVAWVYQDVIDWIEQRVALGQQPSVEDGIEQAICAEKSPSLGLTSSSDQENQAEEDPATSTAIPPLPKRCSRRHLSH